MAAATNGSPTIDKLIAAIRAHTERPELDWATPPIPLPGGYWAEMYIVELADAPPELAGRLVARIMPDPATAAFEIAVQRHLSNCGLSVPAIRAADGPSADLDRAWCLMDFASGQPLLSGLGAATVIKQAPTIMRRLPDLLAESTARLHRCPVEGLEAELAGQSRQPDIGHFLERIATQAKAIERDDLARMAEQLAATIPGTAVICHGDLHPFNLLVDADRWTLIDWSSTVVADPHYDLAYTTLMLSNPPLGGPAPIRAAGRAAGRRIAGRFLRSYARTTGRPIDHDRLIWGRRAHSLRALVEMATWEFEGQLAEHAGHPWLAMRPLFINELAR